MSATTAVPAQTRIDHRILPKGWPDFLLQLFLFALVDLAYEASRTFAKGDVAAAFNHARDVVVAEQALGIFNEVAVQEFTLRHSLLLDVANLTYFNAHFGVTTVFMFWLYLRRNHHYYFIRNVLFATMAIALSGYLLYPTAPPRMLTDLGFIDTLEKFASVNHDSGPIASLSNPFAAMPSVHTAFALFIGLSGFILARTWARWLWLGYPVLIIYSIVATANHFWLDAVAGAFVASLAFLVAWTVERYRPTLPRSARRRLRLEHAP
jgi:membrane-associated phospholipid phosphatase